MTRHARLQATTMLAMTLGAGLMAEAMIYAQTAAAPVTDQDRAEIQQLTVKYTRALNGCASKEYASLFTPEGLFRSDSFRNGEHPKLFGSAATLVGRAMLAKLVETEPFCSDPVTRAARQKAAGEASTRPAPAVAIEPTPGGAKGTIPLGNGARYEDIYVKTQEGWRIASRTVVMPPATTASTTAAPSTPAR